MKNNSMFPKKKFQKGLSLIEASMVLVLSAVVVAGVMVYYQSAQDNNKMEQTLSQTLSLVGGVNGLYAGQSNYYGLDSKTIAQSGAVPASAIDGSGHIINGFGTTTDAFGVQAADGSQPTQASEASAYALVLRKLTKAQCTKVASQKINGSLVSTAVQTNDTNYEGDKTLTEFASGDTTPGFVTAAKITPALMAELCSTAAGGTSQNKLSDVIFILK